jgi:hypothetical protein
MPNWVYSSLTVEGNPELVTELKNQLNTPYTREHDEWNMETQQMELKEYIYSNPIFSFWNIIRPTDLATYALQRDPANVEGSLLFAGNNWYDWNVRNWGSKWDVGVSDDDKWPDTELLDEEENGENLVLVYKFNTAWSPAVPAILKLSEQYPKLLLTLNYQEEQGWGGEIEFIQGKIISESSYDWQCRECGFEADETPYCEDCCYDMCPSCGYGEPDEEDLAKCPAHNVELAEQKG